MIHGVLVAAVGEHALAARSTDPQPARDRTMSIAATRARTAWDGLIGDRDRLARYAVAATPIEEVAALPIGSRPSARRAGLSFDDLRAIPWVFSWNQSRHGIPGWYGLGSALDAIADTEGPARARDLYREWPFFAALVDNAQLALARADLDVAACYARLADDDARGLFDLVRDEHERTVRRVLEVTEGPHILAAWPTLAHTVERRNPYVDVLSHAQIELLARLRATAESSARDRIREVLFITINGIAAGLQTAG